ncbi:MAG: VpsF family polysaccharide biosynthesis protein [Steroidobacteraceae bacterium]
MGEELSLMQTANAYPAIGTDRNSRILLRFFFALFWTFVLLRFIINTNVLDQVVNYSADGGSIFEKIHPSTYGIVLVLIAVLASTRVELNTWELRALRSFMLFGSVIVVLAITTLLLGHTGSLGYLLDSYLVACGAGALMLFFPRVWRQFLGTSLLIFIAVGACLALVEFALQGRLLPYPLLELSFRPTGLSEHPLVLGLFNAIGINFTAASRWKASTKAVVIITMLLGTLAAGARIASIVAGLSVLSVVALYGSPLTRPQTHFRTTTLWFFAAVLVLPAALAILVELGLFERFQDGLFDESAMARVKIYSLFYLVSWNDILFGTDIGKIRNLALQHFDLEFIESSIIIMIFQFGLFGAIIFLLFMARTFLVLLSGAGRHVIVGTLAFFIIASGNNSLSTKTPIVLMIILLIVAFHEPGRDPVNRSR